MTTRYDTATSTAPTPDDKALWCARCNCETWHRMETFPEGQIEIGGRTVTYARAVPHCRNSHARLEVVR